MIEHSFERRASKSLTALAAAVAISLVSVAAHAQTISRGPIIQNPNALMTTMTIEWWTGTTTGDSTVEYGTTTGLGLSVTVGQAGSCDVGNAGTCHAVLLTGLSPNTRYFY